MKLHEIGGVPIDRDRPFLILEAGVNHEGSLSRAIEMIDAAAQAGAAMIKFQSYKAATLASRDSPSYWDRTQEPAATQYELFKKLDSFGDDEYRQLYERCRQKGILFLSTPFDSHFVDFLDAYMPVYKIASADITNLPLLRQVAGKGKPVLLSAGASYLAEVEEAVRILTAAGARQLAILHCVLEYPARTEHANLNTIPYLKTVFPEATIGWSDHIAPKHGCLSLLVAWLLGADILEKHYTLDKTLPGNDHYHALDPDDVREFLAQQAAAAKMLGQWGKTVLPWEEIPRQFARRSLVAACDIPAGTAIRAEMLTAKRPGTGISPMFHDLLLGVIAAADIREDELLQWQRFLPKGPAPKAN
jgi:N-acetylneuraminate synthase